MKTRDKRTLIKKCRNKRIWPSIIIFATVLVVSIYMVSMFVQTFSNYIVTSKLSRYKDQAKQIGIAIDNYLSDGYDIDEAVERASGGNKNANNPAASSGAGSANINPADVGADNPADANGTAPAENETDLANTDGKNPVDAANKESKQVIYVTDADGNYVASTNDDEPVLTASFVIPSTDEDDITLYADQTEGFFVTDDSNQLVNLSINEILRELFLDTAESDTSDVSVMTRDAWMSQNIMEQSFWMQAQTDTEDYVVYVRATLQIEREDLFYICMIGAIAFLLLLIPLTFLFINTLSTVFMQRRVTTLLFMDHVTGGKNWLFFRDYVDRHLYNISTSRKAYALVNLQLDRYQNYCACYGVKDGEDLLESLDAFLEARMQKREVFARYANADFALLMQCEGSNEEEYKAYCTRRLRSLLAELTGLRPDQKIHFHAGVYLIPPAEPEEGKRFRLRERLDVDQIFNYANSALEKGHTGSNAEISFFNQELLTERSWEHFIEDNMETALANGEFVVYLQPKYNPADNRLVGAEALVRWQHPEKGLIPPGKFIPFFEENGFITKIDDYMISEVAKLQAEWTIQKRKQIPVSVNISRAHFAQEGLAEHIAKLVDAYGPQHELIELEVTESAFFDDKDILIETVKQLKAMGFRVSMDDFGAGYSSLNSLKDIPLDVLKLDGEFFRGDDTDGRGRVVVREAIQLARNLNMRIVAEGIEHKEQVDFLADQGCDMIQGFYFAKPMPVEEFEKRVEQDA